MSAKPVNVKAVLGEAYQRLYVLGETVEDAVLAEELLQAGGATAELIQADLEYDSALSAIVELNLHIAGQGWMEVEFDALRKAGSRLVAARCSRADAIARVGGVA